MLRAFNRFLQQNTAAPFGRQQACFVRGLPRVVDPLGTGDRAFDPQRIAKQIGMQSHRRNIHHVGGFRCDDLVGVAKPVKLWLGDFETVVWVGQQSANTLAQQALGQTGVEWHFQV